MRPINRAEVAAERDSAAGPPLRARLTSACEQGTTPLARNGRRLSVASAEGESVSELSKSSLCLPARTCKGGGVHGATSTSDEGGSLPSLATRAIQFLRGAIPPLLARRNHFIRTARIVAGGRIAEPWHQAEGDPLMVGYARSAAPPGGERRWARFVHAWADGRKLVGQSVF
jgi:hypothetical protein